MPTEQPSNAPADLPADARDRDTAAAVIADENLDDGLGGGGPGGSARAPLGTSPNAPMTGTPGGGSPEREAQVRSLGDTAEPHPSSQ